MSVARYLTFGLVGIILGGLLPGCRPASQPDAGGLNAIQPTDDVAIKMVRFAEQATIDARKIYHKSLDYSPESIATVEDILNQLSRAPNFTQYTDKDLRAEALVFGAYIGEVIRRQHGGHWVEDHPRAGTGTYPLFWGKPEHASFPYAWCYKRLTLGAEENVLHKYQYFVTKQLDANVAYEVTKEPLKK